MMEIWKPIPGYEGRYSVSNCGRVKSLRRIVPAGRGGKGTRVVRERILAPDVFGSGHRRVRLSDGETREARFIHRLVLEAFIGPCPDGYQSCHWDGDASNNCLENLRWGARLDNAFDDIRLGKTSRGSKCGTSKIDEMQVISIRRLAMVCGWPIRQIADLYGISRRHADEIKNCTSWGWLLEDSWLAA